MGQHLSRFANDAESSPSDRAEGAGFANLRSRRALVTGASSGIGRAIALEFAAAGADVVVHARSRRGEAERTAEGVRELGSRCAVLLADVATPADRVRLLGEAFETWGGIDVWVNNAGADVLTGDDAHRSYEEKLARLLAVDVEGTVLLSKEAGRRMREAGGGVLLTVGWDQAATGMGGDSGELFAASKSAIMGFTRSLAVSLAPHVRVNCIAPGWIRTAWGESASDTWQQRVVRETPLARWGIPEDVARAARFLCSDAASFVTGQVLNVNGGVVR